MSDKQSGAGVLWRVNIGFSLIMFFNWGAEIIRLPHLLYGDPATFSWSRVLVRTVAIGVVWAWTHLTVRRLVKRLHHLEEFLILCAWCRKVGHEGNWLTMEQYFGSKFDTQTSHGICPECAEKARARFAHPPAVAGEKR